MARLSPPRAGGVAGRAGEHAGRGACACPRHPPRRDTCLTLLPPRAEADRVLFADTEGEKDKMIAFFKDPFFKDCMDEFQRMYDESMVNPKP